jgi:L-ascorbate metabolism protein UlaG (beta-lactamase superfamily)
MATPHLIKIFGYMYQLNKRNFKVYKKPVLTPKSEDIIENSIHWVGHATTVINLDGKIIVTDPVMGNLGHIKRLVTSDFNLKNLHIDYLLLTHGHMDHLNYRALRLINKDTIVIIPRGMKTGLKLRGFKNIVLLRAEETYKDADLEIKCIQAKHHGNRYPWIGFRDSNSYLISSKNKSVFFAGDTADTNIYDGLKSDVAIMPVGCYKPDDFLKMHCSPEQSFNMFKRMDCKLMLPIHYKTYILSQDDDSETAITLESLNDGSMKIIDIGQTILIE